MTQLYPSAYDLIDSYESSTGEQISAPVNLDKIARFLGIRIKEDPRLDRDNIVGQICFEKEYPVISINPQKNIYTPHRRFTLAHEIGHLCLHNDNIILGFTDSLRNMSKIGSFWNTKESQANYFAAQLLMPRHLIAEEGSKIIAAWQAANDSRRMPVEKFTQEIACKFSVSLKAMEYRLEEVGVIKMKTASTP